MSAAEYKFPDFENGCAYAWERWMNWGKITPETEDSSCIKSVRKLSLATVSKLLQTANASDFTKNTHTKKRHYQCMIFKKDYDQDFWNKLTLRFTKNAKIKILEIS